MGNKSIDTDRGARAHPIVPFVLLSIALLHYGVRMNLRHYSARQSTVVAESLKNVSLLNLVIESRFDKK